MNLTDRQNAPKLAQKTIHCAEHGCPATIPAHEACLVNFAWHCPTHWPAALASLRSSQSTPHSQLKTQPSHQGEKP